MKDGNIHSDSRNKDRIYLATICENTDLKVKDEQAGVVLPFSRRYDLLVVSESEP